MAMIVEVRVLNRVGANHPRDRYEIYDNRYEMHGRQDFAYYVVTFCRVTGTCRNSDIAERCLF